MKTKNNNNESSNQVGKQDRALNLFADMMIEKIETLQGDWKKPWFTEGFNGWPRNISGREYNGMNTMMLLMHCEDKGYKLPVFLTYNRCVSLNFQDSADGRVPATDSQGNKLPWVHVLKDEKSFPVFLTTFTVKDKDGNTIKYDDYKQLSSEEQERYTVYPGTTVYDVFNIEQTNLREARPELYNKIAGSLQSNRPAAQGESFTFEAFDRMVAENQWLCPIRIEHQDNACYSPGKDEILLPEKSQFDKGQSFYSTAFHECIHSTNKELQRQKEHAPFGSPAYATEELVAELGAALTAYRYGFLAHIKDESAAYLGSWLKSLREEPSFIRTVLFDVKRATSILTQCLDALGGVAEQSSEAENDDSAIMKQYQDLKGKHPEAILLFRSGDFYQAFEEDAVQTSGILGITLSKRQKDNIRTAIFPSRALDSYLPKLVRAGFKVAICDDITNTVKSTGAKSEKKRRTRKIKEAA